MEPIIQSKILAITWESLDNPNHSKWEIININIPITNEYGFNLDIQKITDNVRKEINKVLQKIEADNLCKIKLNTITCIHQQ